MGPTNTPLAVITDTRGSPFAHLKPVSIRDVQLEDEFWNPRLKINQEVTLKTQYALLESTGRLDNFLRAAGKLDKPYQGFVYNDSDVYKWLESASWTLLYGPDDELHHMVDHCIALISSAQQRDGYVNTYFSLDRSAERWTNLREKHELYCAGHLIQAAIAYFRATGEADLLNVAIRLADHIDDTFGPSKREGTPGHPEIEMALVELYRTTGNSNYLELAKFFIDRRGHGLLGGSEYLVDHVPFRNMVQLAGHAVRAMYLCSGATDLALETGETELTQALDRLWSNMAHQQIYVTGGAGARYDGEAFGEPYELPNARAYAETCAAIASVMWNWRMLQREGDARYADLLEWTFYNAVLAGISLDGRLYFYVNPLADNGNIRRQEWFPCACCPPNVSRTIAMLPGFIYSMSAEGVWVNLYAASRVRLELPSGQTLHLRQITSYPWQGHVTIEITGDESSHFPGNSIMDDASFSIFLRIPAWLEGKRVGVKINGDEVDYRARPGRYLEIHSSWQTGDRIDLDFPMEVQYLESHPSMLENTGRVAITRGPLVYCLEEVDNPAIPLSQVMLETDIPSLAEYQPDLLGGMVQLTCTAHCAASDPVWEGKLYRPYKVGEKRAAEPAVEVKCIPYFAWANRGAGSMQVWYKHT